MPYVISEIDPGLVTCKKSCPTTVLLFLPKHSFVFKPINIKSGYMKERRKEEGKNCLSTVLLSKGKKSTNLVLLGYQVPTLAGWLHLSIHLLTLDLLPFDPSRM